MHCGCTRPPINTPPRHEDNALKLPRTSGFTLTFHTLIRIRPRSPPELPKARLHSLQPCASLPSNVKNSDRLHRPHLIHSHAPATSSSSPGAQSLIPLVHLHFSVFPSSADTFIDAALLLPPLLLSVLPVGLVTRCSAAPFWCSV